MEITIEEPLSPKRVISVFSKEVKDKDVGLEKEGLEFSKLEEPSLPENYCPIEKESLSITLSIDLVAFSKKSKIKFDRQI